MKQENLNAARRLQQEVENRRWMDRKIKKDAVLHLRVASDILDQIKAEASARDMSVSDLVRCYLVERFSTTPLDNGSHAFLLATTAFTNVVTMQDSWCAVCGKSLPHGETARLACGPPPPARLVCDNCFANIQSQFEE